MKTVDLLSTWQRPDGKGWQGITAGRELCLTAPLFLMITSGITVWLDLALVSPGLMLAGYAVLAMVIVLSRAGGAALGWANRVTFYRALAVVVLAALLVAPDVIRGGQWGWTGLALLVLLLDGLDGYLARRLGLCSDFGARFDMEVDAALILTLCVGVWSLGIAGAWVLALGLMRYGFVLAGWACPRLSRPLPESFRRKTICVWQIASLVIVLLPVTPSWLASWVLALALVLLAYSFTVDLAWLYRAGGKHERNWSE